MPPTDVPPQAGLVSVVILNYRGCDDTLACLAGLDGLDWDPDRLQIVVVDNASGDGSAQRIRAALDARPAGAATTKLVESPTNTGFAGGCNLGARHATGEFLALLNNDARPDPQWVRAAVAALDADPTVACVASKVLDWEGTTIDYVDGSVTFFGMGYKREVGRPDDPAYDVAQDVLFATGAALIARTVVFREVGGFDERYFMFYEDVDLGWRLNLLGHRVRYVPASIAFHRHHASIGRFGQWREDFLLERNALFTLYKNYSDRTLAAALPAALLLSVRRSLVRAGVDAGTLDLAQGAAGDDVPTLNLPKGALTGTYAADAFTAALPDLARDREALQRGRRRSDADLLPLFRHALEPAEGAPGFLAAYRDVVDAFGIESLFNTRHRVLIVTKEPLGARLAGPAIRVWEMARVLSVEQDVVLASLVGCELSHPRFTARGVSVRELREEVAAADVVVVQGFVLEDNPWLVESDAVLVVDVYDPFHLEQLEQVRDLPTEMRGDLLDSTVSVLNRQLTRGDFFLCASDKQRDLWLGQLAALGRVNPQTYAEDESLRSLIDVVPFGLPEKPPEQRRHAVKGALPGIGLDDPLLLWAGGIYNWFDPLTLLRAVDRLRERVPNVRLLFLGVRHPSPEVPAMRTALVARELSDALGLTGTHVFFNEQWVAYDERADYLLDADVAVSTAKDGVETAFSFRTRILDHLWAGLPSVTTRGDTLADLIEAERLGLTVPAGDVEALEEALFRLLTDRSLAAACGQRAREAAANFTWERTLTPLLAFCRAPRPAADRASRRPAAAASAGPVRLRPAGGVTKHGSGLRAELELARDYLALGGRREVARKVRSRLRRVIREERAGSTRRRRP